MDKEEDGPEHRGGYASDITIDYGGNVVVGGAFRSSATSTGSDSGLRLAAQVYSSDGTSLWQRAENLASPGLVCDGISINIAGSVIVGGTSKTDDGNWRVHVARFGSDGVLNLDRCIETPANYNCFALRKIFLFESGSFILEGQLGHNGGTLMRERSTIGTVLCDRDGNITDVRSFDSSPESLNTSNDSALHTDLIATGQTGFNFGKLSMFVIHY